MDDSRGGFHNQFTTVYPRGLVRVKQDIMSVNKGTPVSFAKKRRGCKIWIWIHGLILVTLCTPESVLAAWTDSSTPLSVITGATSVFPAGSTVGGVKLPKTLQGKMQPESFHPNLRFWFTPDAFEEANTADGTVVSSWRNVANICFTDHPSAECTSSKVSNLIACDDQRDGAA
jgi:hypothetical protein